jgi:drug/metabolite transporter (DMT)-like permease
MRGDARPTAEAGWDWAGLLLVQTLFGLVAASAFTLGEQALGAAPIRWGPWTVAALLYVSLGASILAYRAWALGVAEGGPALAAFFNNLTPLFAALLSAAVLGEPPKAYHAAAFALIVGGILVSARRGVGR